MSTFKITVSRLIIRTRSSQVFSQTWVPVSWSMMTTIRAKSIQASSVKVERISDNLSFRPAVSSSTDPTGRPIVLIYAWLVAKSRHIHKFGDFYLGKGFDVLHIKVNPGQILWPAGAQKVASQVVDFITAPSRRSQPVLVHGFSVGGYVYGETLVQIAKNPALVEEMSQRVRGQIFDSPVDLEGIPRGVSRAVTGSAVAQFAIKSTLESYLALFSNHVTRHYHMSSKTFRSNPLRSPSLLLYSFADLVGTPGPIMSVMEGWHSRGVPVYSKTWNDSPHVTHYRHDPINYTIAVNNFLQIIGLDSSSNLTQEELPLIISKL